MSEAANTVLQRLINHAIGAELEPLEAARLAARLVLGLRSAVGSNRTTAGPEGHPAATGPAEQVRLYKHVWADVDGDGTDELCFAAGSSDFFADCVWALIDPGPHGLRFVNLVEGLDSFRDLQVRDINHDGMLEVICTNLVGSGAFLSHTSCPGTEQLSESCCQLRHSTRGSSRPRTLTVTASTRF